MKRIELSLGLSPDQVSDNLWMLKGTLKIFDRVYTFTIASQLGDVLCFNTERDAQAEIERMTHEF